MSRGKCVAAEARVSQLRHTWLADSSAPESVETSLWQRVAVCFSDSTESVQASVLQRVAACCSELQCVAVILPSQ